jgi:DNA-binding NarL/FixJ family response regulator
MPNQIRIGILEDHAVTAAGLQSQLDQNSRLDVSWMAHYFQDMESKLTENPTDILILDIGLPNSPEDPEPYPIFHVIPQVLAEYPEIKILVISMHSRPVLFKMIKDAGASGYILKHDVESFQKLDQILIDLHDLDSIYYSPEVIETLANQQGPPVLSPRQAEILSLIASHPGMSTTLLAEKLSLAHSTIRNHLSDIYLKLGVSNRAAAIMKARQIGLIADDAEYLPPIIPPENEA